MKRDVLRSAVAVGLLAFVSLLVGCGADSQGKGPALPYTPRPGEALPRAMVKTDMGEIEVELFEDDCPNIVANFITLAEEKFYDGKIFHRIVSDFCVQGGCPKGDGTSGPGYKINDEFYDGFKKNLFGTLAMANSGANTNGSQFFFNINKKKEGNSSLDRKHVVFGKVIKGIEVVEKLGKVKTLKDLQPKERPEKYKNNRDRPVNPPKIVSIRILKKRDHVYEVQGKVPDKDAADKKDDEKQDEKKSDAKKDVEKTDAKKDEGKKADKKEGAKEEKSGSAKDNAKKTADEKDVKKEANPTKKKEGAGKKDK